MDEEKREGALPGEEGTPSNEEGNPSNEESVSSNIEVVPSCEEGGSSCKDEVTAGEAHSDAEGGRVRRFFARARRILFGKGKNVHVPLERFPLLQCLILSAFVFLIVDMLGYRSPIGGFMHMVTRPHLFLLNVLIVALTMLPAFFFRRRYFFFMLPATLWLGLGVTNCVLLSMRVTPLEAVDFAIFKTGFAIMNMYMTFGEIVLAASAIILALVALFIMWFKLPRVGKVHYVRGAISGGALALVLSLFVGFAGQFGMVPKNFRNLADAYHEYGFAYCFSCSLFDRGIPKPDEYTPETMGDIMAGLSDEKTVAGDKPNIIFLQLESFFNVMDLKDKTFSDDPTPFFNSLKAYSPHGYLTVPSVGAGTANTEFEAITGMSLAYFGTGEYPYKTILQTTVCESMPYLMRDMGYTATAIHNHTGSFYDRDTVYPKLGFDYYISREYMTESDNRNPIDWVRDEVLVGEIKNALTHTDGRDYIYAVSVQGHGGYPTYDIYGSEGITVTGGFLEDQEELAYQYAYFVNQLREMDDFLYQLTEMLKAFDEDVVLVMYGDHLPSLGLKTEDFRPNTADLFQTEYVIWSNYGLEKNMSNERLDLCSYQLAAYVTDILGIHEGAVLRYHQSRETYVPAETDEAYDRDLRMLQYDILYGEQYIYHGKTPYETTDMQMGIYKIKIKEVLPRQGGFVVYGERFTPQSIVLLNDKRMSDVVYMRDDASGAIYLVVPYDEALETGDVISVLQTGDDLTNFSKTTFTYGE